MPMPEPPVSWERIQNRVSDLLGVPVSGLDPRYAGICSEANRQAWISLYMILSDKGYSQSHLLQADQLIHWQQNIALVIAMGLAATFSSYNLESLKLLDPREEIRNAGSISIAGSPTAPGAGESQVGGVAFGMLKGVSEVERRWNRRR
jgi:hypothetical protein